MSGVSQRTVPFDVTSTGLFIPTGLPSLLLSALKELNSLIIIIVIIIIIIIAVERSEAATLIAFAVEICVMRYTGFLFFRTSMSPRYYGTV